VFLDIAECAFPSSLHLIHWSCISSTLDPIPAYSSLFTLSNVGKEIHTDTDNFLRAKEAVEKLTGEKVTAKH
jgi:hypothetical protein